MICTRPDLSYALSMTSKYQANPGEGHWTAVKNILKYLRRTKDVFLVYGGEEELRIKGYTDASFQTDKDDSRSQSGFVFCLNGGAVSWKSSKEDTVAYSTTEAEYIADSEAAKEAVWIKKRFHLIREIIDRGDVEICKVHTDDNIAHPLTKPLAQQKHDRHTESLGIRYIKNPKVAAQPSPLDLHRLLLSRERDCAIFFAFGKEFPKFCSLVYSGGLSRDLDEIFVEIQDPTDPSEGAGNTEQLHLSEEDIFDWHTPMEHQSQLKQADIPGSFKADDAPALAEPPSAQEHTPRRRGKTPAKRIVLSDRSSSPEQLEQQPAKQMQRRNIWSISYGKKKLHFKEYMIQGFCQNQVGGRINKNQSDPLEVPGNRLPETGSRWTLPPARGACFDQRPRIHSGRKFKYLPRHLPRQARTIQQGLQYDQHIFPNTIKPGARQTKAQDISRADPKPKHAKPTWSTSLSREKSYFIRITLLYDF
ncbi:hypothetical protein V6N13_059670 [Hibiscus sabdariffa]